MFALVMTLPLDLEQRRERVGALVAMMLGLGYTTAAISPFVLGAVRDVTGSFDAVLWVVRRVPRPARRPRAAAAGCQPGSGVSVRRDQPGGEGG